MPTHFYTIHWKSGNWEVFDSIDALIARIDKINKRNMSFITWIEVE